MNKQLSKASRIAVNTCMGVGKEEIVVIICDEPCRNIGYELWNCAKQSAAEAIFCEISPRNSNGEEPPSAVAELLRSVDVALIPTSKSMSHTDARREASKTGVRIATLPGITEETMIRTLNADYKMIGDLSRELAAILKGGKIVNIKTDIGTDVDLYIEGRESLADTGLNHSKGSFSNLPAGEAYIAPVENRSSGRIVYDGSMAAIGLLRDEVIEVNIADGYATDFRGGKSAEKLYQIMKPFGKNAFNVAELGIGTNDKALITGNVLEDEKALGTVHIALGDNMSMGGKIAVPSHLDGVIKKPTVTVDGEVIMEKGQLRITN